MACESICSKPEKDLRVAHYKRVVQLEQLIRFSRLLCFALHCGSVACYSTG